MIAAGPELGRPPEFSVNPGGGPCPRFRLRPAGPADAPVLGRLGPATFREAFGAVLPAEAVAERMRLVYARARLAQDLRDPAQAWFLAVARRGAVGFLALREGPPQVPMGGQRPVEFTRVYVRSAWHGRGPAFALMEAGFAEARRRGADLLWLTAWERNPRALAFYRAHGFRPADRVPVTFAGQVLPHLLMARTLSP